jgi:undecaprenyl diphosphate synthase
MGKRERKAFFAGHAAGADVLREICKACIKAGVKILTIYAFSVENWHRSDIEVKLLLRLLRDLLSKKGKVYWKIMSDLILSVI